MAKPLTSIISFTLLTLAIMSISGLISGCGLRREEPRREPAARTSMSTTEAETIVYRQVNDYRQSRGLPALARDRHMSEQAREHSHWMAARDDLSHRGSERRFRDLQDEPTRLRSFSENVAYNFGHADPPGVAVDGWIRSSGHHTNMTQRNDEMTGVGVARASDGSWYFTQLFGRR